MPYIVAFVFFLACMTVERFSNKTAHADIFEPATNANAGGERTTGKLIFGEHWQAWADAISSESEEPWEEQAA